jgi:hypothetical protein
VTHRDEVEAPITDWLREAYELSDVLAVKVPASREAGRAKKTASRPKKKKKGTLGRHSRRRRG